MAQDISVTGLAALQQYLNQLPAKVERNIMTGALRSGANVIRKAAKAAAPIGPPSSSGRKKYKLYEGALRDSVRVTTRTRGGIVTATVHAGGKLKNGAVVFYAHMIERTGAVAHLIKAQKGSALTIAGQQVSEVPDHPGMDAKPFMRPALDTQAGAAFVATGNYVKQRLQTKEGLDTADIVIELAE